VASSKNRQINTCKNATLVFCPVVVRKDEERQEEKLDRQGADHARMKWAQGTELRCLLALCHVLGVENSAYRHAASIAKYRQILF
jgi:hypothetical protein